MMGLCVAGGQEAAAIYVVKVAAKSCVCLVQRSILLQNSEGRPIYSKRETATILAALWYWREEMCPHGPKIMRPYFQAIGMPLAKPLSAHEIVTLSARIRTTLPK
jgi:hypothetical protein